MVGGLCNAQVGNSGHVVTTLIKYNAWVNMLEKSDDSDQANRERWPIIPLVRFSQGFPAKFVGKQGKFSREKARASIA